MHSENMHTDTQHETKWNGGQYMSTCAGRFKHCIRLLWETHSVSSLTIIGGSPFLALQSIMGCRPYLQVWREVLEPDTTMNTNQGFYADSSGPHVRWEDVSMETPSSPQFLQACVPCKQTLSDEWQKGTISQLQGEHCILGQRDKQVSVADFNGKLGTCL